MRQFMKLYTIFILFVMINLTFVPFFYFENTKAASQDPHEDQHAALQTTYFFMRSGKLLHPESAEPDDTPKTIACPSASAPMFPRLPFNKPRVYEWVSMPTNFESNALNSPIDLGHSVMFRLWFTAQKEENLGTIRFQFTLLHNNNPIAQSDSTSYSNLDSGDDAFVTASAGINVTGNRIPVGDTLGIHIDYYVTGEGLAIKYDNPLYDSGMEIECNPLKISEISGSRKQINTFFSESFNVNIRKLLFIAIVDEIPVEELPLFTTTTQGRRASWTVDLEKGTHIVTLMLSYGANANESMVIRHQEVKIDFKEPIKFLGKDLNFWFSIIVLIIILALVVTAVRVWKNRRDEQMLMELESL